MLDDGGIILSKQENYVRFKQIKENSKSYSINIDIHCILKINKI